MITQGFLIDVAWAAMPTEARLESRGKSQGRLDDCENKEGRAMLEGVPEEKLHGAQVALLGMGDQQCIVVETIRTDVPLLQLGAEYYLSHVHLHGIAINFHESGCKLRIGDNASTPHVPANSHLA